MNNSEDLEKRIKQRHAEQAKMPLIHRGWVCDDPAVKMVWFVGYGGRNPGDEMKIRMEMIFESGARHSIDQSEVVGLDGNIEELLAAKGDEYLRNGGKGSSALFTP